MPGSRREVRKPVMPARAVQPGRRRSVELVARNGAGARRSCSKEGGAILVAPTFLSQSPDSANLFAVMQSTSTGHRFAGAEVGWLA
jgi:hypothetical protein